ncbi:MAG TPA: glycerol-3-phosphate dehydrogenase subunit GlpB [Herpetosiphonaceae bacterium]|nr:glycerol-3-phosphate dehydrogenase subunit GlpB [Herpetosiphonaceae bacterium]
MSYDVIVIGAGLAGLAAATRQAQAGRRTLLLAKGQGSLPWSSGCIDLWPAADPRAAIAGLPAEHPYRLAGLPALDDGLAWLRDLARAARYPLAGSAGRCLELPTALGTWRPTALAPHTMIAAERSAMAGPVLVAGWPELRDFYPPLIAARLSEQGYQARGIYLPAPPSERTLDFSSMQMARLFEDAAFRQAIGRQLRQRRGDARLILLPAVLGLGNAAAIVAELQALSGALVAEVPTLPTNVPGMRLQQLLANALIAAGGRLQLNAEVVRADWDGPALRRVWTRAAVREQGHAAERFVLATGGIGGGGLRAEYAAPLRETALDLPVRQPASRDAWFDPDVHAVQPVYAAGVAADERLRPIDAGGAAIATNLRVAGAALAGADLIRQRCVEGVALATGWRAGEGD